MGHFRRLGFEPEDNVKNGAHQFKLNIENLSGIPSVLVTQKMFLLYRMFELIIWEAKIKR